MPSRHLYCSDRRRDYPSDIGGVYAKQKSRTNNTDERKRAANVGHDRRAEEVTPVQVATGRMCGPEYYT